MNLFLGNTEAIGSGYLLLSVCYFLLFLLCYHYHFLFHFHSIYIRGLVKYLLLSLLNTLIGFMVKDVVPPSGRADISVPE